MSLIIKIKCLTESHTSTIVILKLSDICFDRRSWFLLLRFRPPDEAISHQDGTLAHPWLWVVQENVCLRKFIDSFKPHFPQEPHRATDAEMQAFHSDDYINHLKVVRPSMIKANTKQANIQYNIGESDCPCFKGLWEFSQISAGASLDAAIKLNHGSADICVNWAGK